MHTHICKRKKEKEKEKRKAKFQVDTVRAPNPKAYEIRWRGQTSA